MPPIYCGPFRASRWDIPHSYVLSLHLHPSICLLFTVECIRLIDGTYPYKATTFATPSPLHNDASCLLKQNRGQSDDNVLEHIISKKLQSTELIRFLECRYPQHSPWQQQHYSFLKLDWPVSLVNWVEWITESSFPDQTYDRHQHCVVYCIVCILVWNLTPRFILWWYRCSTDLRLIACDFHRLLRTLGRITSLTVGVSN